jgi:2-methylcitrate dehydratase PrpD
MSRTDVNAEAADLGETMADEAEYLTGVTFEDLPDQVIDRQRWHLLDTLGCILYGTSTPWVQKVLDTLDAMEETGHGNAGRNGISLPSCDYLLRV